VANSRTETKETLDRFAEPMNANPRQRMIQSAALLMRERGIEATSFTDVLELSGAPRGSIYHHFPDGKSQLVEEATKYAGDYVAGGLAAALAGDSPVDAFKRFASLWRGILAESNFGAGCPVVAATLEGDRSPGARDAAGAAFARWEELLGGAIESQGVEAKRASSLATLIVAAIEGGVILSRAEQSIEPLERVVVELERQLDVALAA
jgi:AcrR family transcriptional regulator